MSTRVITDMDEVEEIFWGDSFKPVTKEEIVGESRWSKFKEQVFLEVSTGKYVLVEWEVGATECQEVDTSYVLTEVEPYMTTVTKYRKVTKD